MSGIVHHHADGSISVRADTGIAVVPVTVGDDAVRVTVDAAFPDRVVDLAAASPEALRTRAARFRDGDSVRRIAAAADGEVVDAPVLADAWARIATVAAVDAVHLGPLDDAVVHLDTAHARALAGDPDADRYYAFGAAVVDRLVDELRAARAHGPVVARTAEAVEAASAAVFRPGRRAALLRALADADDVTDRAWRSLSADVADPSPTLALSLNRAVTVDAGLADLAPLRPRLLRFDGPDEPEISVRHLGDGTVVLAAALRNGVDETTEQAAGIFAVVADARSGEPVAHAPAVLADGQIRARVALNGADPHSIRCAFLDSTANLDALRLDPTGIALTRIDRYCRYAWSQHRLAGALRAALGAGNTAAEIDRAQAAADTALSIAVDAADTALGLVRQLRRKRRDTTDLAHRAAALNRFRDVCAAPPAVAGPTGPTLAELCSVALG
ncbi:hypothetical protein [Gordonia crocea]|uniref:Uncharacterized protein n=1 Tax=Gordonia crocea TaxID=589162 RepID=A0A7M4BQ09_9ACTN|nr:hypothetical protein [Gordonia crocea]GED95970.1 hypothetical protein nbrc107697_00090 [Gordonia crocea]